MRSLPPLPPIEPSVAGLASHSANAGHCGAAQVLIDELWDPVEGKVDLRAFSPDALDDLIGSALRECRDARFVAVPARCPVQAIHTLLLGLPALQGLFAWHPAGAQPIQTTLGCRLRWVVSDCASLSRFFGPADIKRISSGDRDMPLDALVWQSQCATRPRRPAALRTSALHPPSNRPLTICEPEVPTARNDAVGYRLATWNLSGEGSRPASPEEDVPRPVLHQPRRTERLRSACESLFRRVPGFAGPRPRSA